MDFFSLLDNSARYESAVGAMNDSSNDSSVAGGDPHMVSIVAINPELGDLWS